MADAVGATPKETDAVTTERAALSWTEKRMIARRRLQDPAVLVKAVARELGLPSSTVSSWYKRGGWGPKRKAGKRRRIDWDAVRRRLEAGERWQFVLGDFGLDRQVVWNTFRRFGWPRPTLSDRPCRWAA